MINFWEELPKPIFILAPMDGVTDIVFRQIVSSVATPATPRKLGLHGGRGRPDVFFTEFVPVDAILSTAQEKVIQKSLRFSETERPIVAQIWGSDPEKFYKAAQLLCKLKFDGIDINMGCPDKSTIKKGACSALIKNPNLAQEIIHATIRGAGRLPVSVKTRIGFGSLNTESWTEALLQTPIAALTLHLRTVSEMSKVPAHWDEIGKAVEIRTKLKSKTLIIGNGDVKSLKEAKEKVKQYGIDGVMVGTGIFENVYLFNPDVDPGKITPKQKIELLLKHARLFKKTFGDTRHFELLKKFVKCYVNNFDGASEQRVALMKTKTLPELINSVSNLTNTFLTL